MKKDNLVKFYLFSIFTLLFMACSNVVPVSSNTNATGKKESDSTLDAGYVIQGNIKIGDALPSGVLAALLSSEKNTETRSATSSFETFTEGLSVYGDGVVITAVSMKKRQEQGTPITVSAVKNSDNILSYELWLDRPGSWNITAELKVVSSGSSSGSSEPVTLLLGKLEDFYVEENCEKITQDIILEPVFESENSFGGDVALSISNTSATVKKVKWTWNDRKVFTDESKRTKTETFSAEGTANFSFSNVPAGSHEVTLSFLDESNKTVYTCMEVVTVYPGYITDCWYNSGSSDSSYLITEEGKCKFLITDDFLSNNKSIEKVDYNVTTTPYVLWSNRLEKASSYDVATNIVTYQNTKYSKGLQLFPSISGSEAIEADKILFDNDGFLLGNGCVYFRKSKSLIRNKESYSGLCRDWNFELNLDELCRKTIPETVSVRFLGIVACTVSANSNVIYFCWNYTDTDWNARYYLSRYDLENGGDNIISCELSSSSSFSSCSILAVSEYEESSGDSAKVKKVRACWCSDNTIYKKTYIVGTTSITEDTTTNTSSDPTSGSSTTSAPSFAVTKTSLDNFYVETSINVTDMMIQGNFLYVLVSASSVEPNERYYLSTKGTEDTSDDEYVKYSKNISTSNGGVLKFDLTKTVFEPSVWSNNSDYSDKKVLGWYTIPNTVGVLYTSSHNALFTIGSEQENPSITTCPPLDNQNTSGQPSKVYFYGACRFVARKPTELVIADDGAYVDVDSSGKFSIEEKDRIVTVDLDTESLSAKDVDVTFSKNLYYYSSSSQFRLGNGND